MTSTHTDIMIIGASVAGLSVAACLHRFGLSYTIIEKESGIAAPWRRHYDRLHLHTPKSISHLPYRRFGRSVQKYPSRLEVVSYLENYQREFEIHPLFEMAATKILREGDRWVVETREQTFTCRFLVIATGGYQHPRPFTATGLETFTGTILHSSAYRNGTAFKDKNVLVIGFGNSACEIAMDLSEQGARPALSVRSAVNVIPRDMLGIPILRISAVMQVLPPKIADTINAPLLRFFNGDITALGLRKLPYGPFVQIERHHAVPVLDIGVLKYIRKRRIDIYPGIQSVNRSRIRFVDDREEHFDAIIAATGYNNGLAKFIDVDRARMDDLQKALKRQRSFGADGLYACGFRISPTGQFREIAKEAKTIAKDIAGRI